MIENFIADIWGYSKEFKVLKELESIPECQMEVAQYMKHYDFCINNNGLFNSILNPEDPVGDIIHLSKQDNDANLVSDKLLETPNNIEEYYKKGDLKKSLENLFLLNISEMDLINMKKALLRAAMSEGAGETTSSYYLGLKVIYDAFCKEFFLDTEKNIKYNLNSVDMIIAETIRCSTAKSFSDVNGMLSDFLNISCNAFRIETEQYNILQKVFSYYGAYEQEKMVLEAMVMNYIPRSEEQEDRLTFLRSNDNIEGKNAPEIYLNGSESFMSEGKCMYEYRSLHWDKHQIEDFFTKLSFMNDVVEYPFVIKEWTKDINIVNAEVKIEAIYDLLEKNFNENYDDRFNLGITETKPLDMYSDYMDTIIITDRDSENGYSWIMYIVSVEKINNKQVAITIYTLYIPLFDIDLKMVEDSVIESNKVCAQKICMLKEMQNPRINRHIQNINNQIIEVLEDWANNENDSVDIYS